MANLDLIENPEVLKYDMSSGMKADVPMKSNQITLQDCFQNFSQEELLKGDDKWYCGKCKDHQIATKKMEIFNAPDYLIIHLKRFSHTRGLWGGRKVDDLITFPVQGLDLSQHILNQSSGQ